MSEFNKSYRIRTEVGKDTHLHVKLDQKYDVLEIMSLKIDQENAYRLHTSNYGVIAGRVLANGSFGIPNAKISVFINIDEDDINDPVKAALYPYNTTNSKDKDGVRYNLLPNEQVTDCHTIIGTFPEKQYALDNNSILEVFEKYYKYTTRTNEAGDYMIFGVPVGSQTIHVDIDLSDIGILSQKPRDMVYKGYNINQFENPNKFKYDTNLNSLTQVISQDNVTEVIPFWGDESEGMIGITRCDIDVQYKFEPTCVFMGSVVSDTASNGISKKCIPSPGMGAMDELTTGSGTIEMIRKKPDGSVEEFQIQGTQLINGDGVWCYQIPMNLDYMMTDEFGNMVPTNDPNKGIPTRTRVRFRISMQDFDTDSVNMFRSKMLVPNNPEKEDDIDYQFGTNTKEESYKDLFWNCVYTVKSYIPRIQKGTNWRNEKFTGFKRVNYYGDKNPIPYNNIRIRIPFMYMIICTLVKFFFKLAGWVNLFIRLMIKILGDKRNGIMYIALDGTLCDDNLENVCIIPGIKTKDDEDSDVATTTGLMVRTVVNFVEELGGNTNGFGSSDANHTADKTSIDTINRQDIEDNYANDSVPSVYNARANSHDAVTFKGIIITNDTNYLIQCIEMNLAQEYRVIQFDFYNDWINGLIYIPRWVRNITKKRTFIFPQWTWGGKVKACNENYNRGKRNIVQQCGLSYRPENNEVLNYVGCDKSNGKLRCHKSKNVRLSYRIFNSSGIVKSIQTLKQQYVYYFKPAETSNSKFVRLYSTDIVLLGTLNSCDKWGIPNDLQELVSSSYQMPTNLVLTDSDLEGREYNSEEKYSGYGRNYDGGDIWGESYIKGGEKLRYLNYGGLHRDFIILNENGNYTELSGIDWGYAGPLQNENIKSYKNDKENESFYKPGGHFLGLSCRNSETTIKSCVNLSRICEYGVWMSQRQELNIPNTQATSKSDSILEYATVPSGLISKEEISDTNFRSIFASLNSNKLKTVINPETGYLVYDFKYTNPTNFGGELVTNVKRNGNYNRYITNKVIENYYQYNDDDYHLRGSKSTVTVDEQQIMRSGEYMDKEYLKFRFNLTEDEFNDVSKRMNKYLITTSTKNPSTNKYVTTTSFPMYENSFYFYFGLHDGKTALDEFKKQYYAICEKTETFVQTDDSLSISNIEIEYDGICPDEPKGKLHFNVKGADSLFDNDGVNIKLYDENNILVKNTTARDSDHKIKLHDLHAGIFSLVLSANDGGKTEIIPIEIGKVSITADINGVNFKKDVSDITDISKFTLNRLEYGGYICFLNNTFVYNKGIEIDGSDDTNEENDNKESIVSDNIFDSHYIKQIIITCLNNSVTIKSDLNNPLIFDYNGTTVYTTVNERGDYMIPVPFEDETYSVYIKTYVGNKCKPYNLAINRTKDYTWHIGDITINNGTLLDFTYNKLSHNKILKNYVTNENWWEAKGISNWQLDEKQIQWAIKDALYMSNLNIPHAINIKNYGGLAPYTEIITGMKDDAKTTEDISRSDFEVVNTPTINYVKDGNRRANFSYQITDSNNQIYPETPFIFPVIYKPFFMEMGAWYFDKNKKYYLIGNVYNGKTWDYEVEGFNNVKLNNVPIANFATITQDDTTMLLNEIDSDGNPITGGGYDYMGPHFKYNGRKTVVSREIEPITYGLHSDGIINNFELSVGSEHEEDSLVYSDKTTVARNAMEFFTFAMSGTVLDDKYCVSMNINVNDSTVKYQMIPVFDDETSGYKYPISGNSPQVSPKLLKALMDDNIKASDLGNLIVGDGYIDVNAVTDGMKSLYYIAIPDNSIELTKTSNTENKIKAISVSNLIDLNTLSKFYPLEIIATANDVLQSDGTYKTTMTIKPRVVTRDVDINNRITENFKNKKYVFTFYNGDTGMTTQTFTIITGNDTTASIDITGYRNILGLKDKSVNLSFYFDVYLSGQKSPTSYLNVGGKPYYMAVTFTDNRPKEETPPAQ